MIYAITFNSSGIIQTTYQGIELPTGYSSITATQFSQIVSGSTWDGTNVNPPATPLAATPTLAQQATTLIAGGINIISTGTPSLNGLYSTSPTAQLNAANVASYININGKFPGASATTMTWLDSTGNAHVFPSTTEFLAFYTAAGDFVADCQIIQFTGTGTLPSNSYTIP